MSPVITRARWIGLIAAAAIVLSVAPSNLQISTAQTRGDSYATKSTTLDPVPVEAFGKAPVLSDAEQKALLEKVLAKREQIADAVDNGTPSKEAAPVGQSSVPESKLAAASETTELGGATEFPGPPDALVIGRNVKNTRASTVGSTLAEPTAINDGRDIFFVGNSHAEVSADHGSTWLAKSLPAGPSDAPSVCCDFDAVYDPGRGITIWSLLYTNATQTNGVVRLFVQRDIINRAVSPPVPANAACSYSIDPGGTANNVLPDYPHLGLSDNFLYLSLNLQGATTWNGAQTWRLNLDNLADCVSAGTNIFTYTGSVGQRVHVPVQGAHRIMYWGQFESTTSFRIFSWPEASSSVSSALRSVSATTFSNPDCRGGTGNFDYIERSTAWSIVGFRMRGAVGANQLTFYTNAGPSTGRAQGYIRGVQFRENDLTLIRQPDIFNSTFCFGFPQVAANDRGDLGISVALGGRAGGVTATQSPSAAQGAIGLDSPASPGFFGTFAITASGTHNRSDNRYGDYFSARRGAPCGLNFAVTNYALLNGTATSNVNVRFVEFFRGRDQRCFTGWSNQVRQ